MNLASYLESSIKCKGKGEKVGKWVNFNKGGVMQVGKGVQINNKKNKEFTYVALEKLKEGDPFQYFKALYIKSATFSSRPKVFLAVSLTTGNENLS